MSNRKPYKKNVEYVEVQAPQDGKLPPNAVELEEAILGAVMLEENAFHEIADLFFPECFYKESHAKICAAILRIYERGEKADILTVTQELKRVGELEAVGGAYYVSSLTNRVASAANIEIHMRLIHQPYIKREAIRSSSHLIKKCYETGSDSLEIIDEWEKELTQLTTQLFVRKAEDPDALYEQVIRDNEMITSLKGSVLGVPSGFRDLDVLTGGWRGSDLIILAARPGMGKTAMAVQMGKYAALNGLPAAIFSLEMSSLQVFKRLCSQETGIPLEKFTTTGMDPATLNTFKRDIANLRGTPLFIDDAAGATIFDIRNKSRKLKREKKIKLIIVDYLQLIVGKENANREQEVSGISRALKALAKELDIPIIALSQLTRQTENRQGSSKRPQLSDLRDSGAIEQDADQVIFLYRPEYYGITVDQDNHPTKGICEVIIAKNRSGPLNEIVLKWKDECVLFNDFNGIYDVAEPVSKPLPKLPDNETFLREHEL